MLFWLLLGFGIALTLIIYWGWAPLNARYIFLTILIAGIAFSTFKYELDWKNFGFGLPNAASIAIYSSITAVGCAFLAINKIKAPRNKKEILSSNKKYFYLIYSVPLQELMARSYPLAIFKYFEWNYWIAFSLFSAAIFSFSHLFLRSKKLLAYTFVIGYAWAAAFYFFPDFLSLVASHFILGWMLKRTGLYFALTKQDL